LYQTKLEIRNDYFEVVGMAHAVPAATHNLLIKSAEQQITTLYDSLIENYASAIGSDTFTLRMIMLSVRGFEVSLAEELIAWRIISRRQVNLPVNSCLTTFAS